MSQFSDYTNGILARLTARAALPGSKLSGVTMLLESAADIGTLIDKAIGEVGMLILIGRAPMRNTQQSKRIANMTINSQIAVGEVPTLWRNAPVAGPAVYADDGTAMLQGLTIGQSYHWKPGADDVSLTSGATVLNAEGDFTAADVQAALVGTPSAAYTGSVTQNRPIADDVAQEIMEALAGFTIVGYQPLRIAYGQPVQDPGKKRNLWNVGIESQAIVEGAPN